LAFVGREQAWIDRARKRWDAARAREVRNALAPDQERTLRDRARLELPARTFALARELGAAVSRVSVRNQRHRWGSCSPRGHICLNWRLVQVPDWVRDYVIVHELMHLRRMDHSPKFWKLVEQACPEYQAARAWLRRWEREAGCAPS
jgi:predicted metal-dependent hydrolase